MKSNNFLRIAYLIQHGPQLEDHGGGIVHAKAIFTNLQERGHAITWFSLKGQRVICTDDLSVCQNASLGLTNMQAYRVFEGGIRRGQRLLHLPYLAIFDSLRFYDACTRHVGAYDVFHERFSMVGIGGVLASRRLGIPLVLEVNADLLDEMDSIGQGPRGFHRLYARWASSFCFSQAALIIAVSSQLKARLVQTWRLPEDKVVVLPNGADIEQFRPQPNPASIRQRLGLGDYPIVIFIGKFFPWHAPLELIESFSLVHAQIPNARLYMVGDGWMRSQAELRSKELGLDSSVIFVGSVPHEQVAEWLAVADVAVATYFVSERNLWFSPLKLFEYMAAGKAIVASRVGQVAEVIQHDETGLLVDMNDIEGVAEAIVGLLQDSHKRQQLGANARQQAVKCHSWSRYVADLTEIYSRIIEERK